MSPLKQTNVNFVMILKPVIIYFFNVFFSEALWTDMQDWLHTKIRLEPFSQKDIIYGVVMDNNEWDFL